ncbi:MAG: hypothetical protein QXI32_01415 [Candidatus Bathyarchaeia archaeon]
MEAEVSPCVVCPDHICYWFRLHPQRCELEVARKYLETMYKLSRPKVSDQEFPSDAHLPSTILRDRPWDMKIGRPTNPSNWLDQFLEKDEETPAAVGKREFVEKHSIRCEFCGGEVQYKTRKPFYNVCEQCKLRIVKSRERGSVFEILSRPESALDSDAYVTPSLPSPMYSPSERLPEVTRRELAQAAPVDRRGVPGTRGTEVTDESLVVVDGQKRVKGALWLIGKMRRMKARKKQD